MLRFISWLLVVCAACAAPASRGLRLDTPTRAPIAEDIDHAELTLPGVGGVALYAQRWRPRTGDPRAVVVVHHGLADHSARYAGFAARLVRAGYAVYAHDMRGHGRSAGVRIALDEIDELTTDLDTLVAHARAQEPGRPVFLFGHSLGGLTTALYAIERQPPVAGVILSAPGIMFDVPAFAAGAIRLVARLAPNAPLLSTPHADFSASREVVADMARDPLIEAPKGPARSSRAAIDGVARVWAHPERLTAPLLAVHGTGDTIVAPGGSRELVARAGNADRTLRLYDGLQHDLLHEPAGGGDRVAGNIVAWIDAHVAGQPSPFPSAPFQRLRGDRGAMALVVDLDARGERTEGDAVGATANMRLRVGLGRVTPLGVGYAGGIDLRAGYVDGALLVADLHAAGLALRGVGGAQLAITAGIGVARASDTTSARVPVEASLELPLGPMHALVRAGVAWRLSGTALGADALGVADEASALLGVRFGRDRRYWPGTAAGAGPFLAITYRAIGSSDIVGIALGGQLWGGS